MTEGYWHDLVTQRSWELLTRLGTRYRFTLIGDWAVFLYAGTLKSKDIDIVIDYDELGRLQAEYRLSKNDRLKKYEARQGEVEIDIYTPHYSRPGLPAEEVARHAVALGGFSVPRVETLLIMKQHAYSQRARSAKGEKDRLDILSLLKSSDVDWAFYKAQAGRHRPASPAELLGLLEGAREVRELGLGAHALSRLKKTWTAALK